MKELSEEGIETVETTLTGLKVDSEAADVDGMRCMKGSRCGPDNDDLCAEDDLSCPANLFFKYSDARGGDAARGGTCGELGRGGEADPVDVA